MSAIEVNIVDSYFQHENYCVPGVSASTFVWRRENLIENTPTVITHDDMYRFDYHTIPKVDRLGLLLESQSVIPRVYSRVRRVIPDYEMVFTHSERLLKGYPNTRWIPGGGIWVGGDYAGGQIGVVPKSRMASMLSSNKLKTPLHRRRYLWASRLERANLNVDVYRQKWRSKSRISVYDTLRDYRYSIIIENFIDDRYFTEKVLNCFATGTVPIYLGARRLDQFFDPRGFIAFDSWRELRRRILPNLSEADYVNRLPAIHENLKRALDYRSVEDFIYRNYLTGRIN
jgi:hypothetical protein